MPTTIDNSAPESALTTEATFLGHPKGLFLLFMVEMWERFSYYGMRALLVLYLVKALNPAPDPGLFSDTIVNPGRGWTKPEASTLYGWYTGLAYLLPIIGGLIADKLIGTHRSMVVGGLLIAFGHVVLGVSGFGAMAHSDGGMAVFIMGLALIVLGTGHFKPTVSVMVGQLYPPGDPRRDGAFSIFYMGINVGAFICAFVCGTLGEQVGWHWGFGAAAVGMILGLLLYLWGKPRYLPTIGGAPGTKEGLAPVFLIGSIVVSALFAYGYYVKAFAEASKKLGEWTAGMPAWVCFAVIVAGAIAMAATAYVNLSKKPAEVRLSSGQLGAAAAVILLLPIVAWFAGVWVAPTLLGLKNGAPLYSLFDAMGAPGFEEARRVVMTGFGLGIAALLGTASLWFSLWQRPGDRGPVSTIFVYMLFNAFFWVAFEQAGSSINLFTDEYTDRAVTMPGWWADLCSSRMIGLSIAMILVGAAGAFFAGRAIFRADAQKKYPLAVGMLVLCLLSIGTLVIGGMRLFGKLDGLANFNVVPTTWFQSVNPLVIILFAPLFGWLWPALAKRNMNPSQPLKIAFGLILLGIGYIVIVWGANAVQAGVPGAAIMKTGMLVVIGTYFLHTMGELCLSPTGLSYVSKAAPFRFLSLLMGIWFVSSFIANLGGGLLAAQVEAIEKGQLKLPWKFGGQADFFFLFVVTSIGAGVVILVASPLLKRLQRSPKD